MLGEEELAGSGLSLKSLSSLGTNWAGGKGQLCLCPPLMTAGCQALEGLQKYPARMELWAAGLTRTLQVRPSGRGCFLLSVGLPRLSEQFRAGLTLLDLFSQSTHSSGGGCRLELLLLQPEEELQISVLRLKVLAMTANPVSRTKGTSILPVGLLTLGMLLGLCHLLLGAASLPR